MNATCMVHFVFMESIAQEVSIMAKARPVLTTKTENTQSKENRGNPHAIDYLLNKFDKAYKTRHQYDGVDDVGDFLNQFPEYHLYVHEDGAVLVNIPVEWAQGKCRWGRVFVLENGRYEPLYYSKFDQTSDDYDAGLVAYQDKLFDLEPMNQQLETREHILQEAEQAAAAR